MKGDMNFTERVVYFKNITFWFVTSISSYRFVLSKAWLLIVNIAVTAPKQSKHYRLPLHIRPHNLVLSTSRYTRNLSVLYEYPKFSAVRISKVQTPVISTICGRSNWNLDLHTWAFFKSHVSMSDGIRYFGRL